MGKAIIVDFHDHSKYVRWCYQRAYNELRQFYTSCNEGSYTDAELMDAKYALWRVHGKYLDLAWQAHFALKVSQATGIGSSHGWSNALRCHQWNHRQMTAGDFENVHSQCL